MKKIILISFALFLAANMAFTQEKRLALIIGNSNYATSPLKNPMNDANLMETTLKGLGFTVIKTINASKVQMEQAIRSFSESLANYNVALFFYAGHGMESNGVNYLIPVDAKLVKESDLKYEAVSVNFIVEEFEQYPQNTNIVILDACRDNPLATWSRGGARGFKAISPSSGTIIAFATAEGSTASDGSGNNGLFTQSLVQQMRIAQPVEAVFKNTRVQVQKASGGKQSPQEWSMLTGNFYFVKDPNASQSAQPQVVELPIGQDQSSNDLMITEEVITGTIKITSEVDGPFIFDGKAKGNFVNGRVYTLNNIVVGEHELMVGAWKKKVKVEQGKTLEIKATKDLPDRFVDSRDGQSYKKVEIGNQVWMAQNLNYDAPGSWCYDGNPSNCVTMGRLYSYNSQGSKDSAKTVCPSGWHLPSKQEFEMLLTQVGGSGANAFIALKEGGSSGFNGMLGGYRDGSYKELNNMGYFWSSTPFADYLPFALRLHAGNKIANIITFMDYVGFSVRCVEN